MPPGPFLELIWPKNEIFVELLHMDSPVSTLKHLWRTLCTRRTPSSEYIWGSTDHSYWWSYWGAPLRTNSYLQFQHNYLYFLQFWYHLSIIYHLSPISRRNTIVAPDSDYFTGYTYFSLLDITLTKGSNTPEMLL